VINVVSLFCVELELNWWCWCCIVDEGVRQERKLWQRLLMLLIPACSINFLRRSKHWLRDSCNVQWVVVGYLV
jgi:hypothetical protein